jgi:putative endonuclease
VGITNNLSRRINEHRSHKTKGSHVIGDFYFLHTEKFTDHLSARKREKFLKSGQGRNWLDDLEISSESAKGG